MKSTVKLRVKKLADGNGSYYLDWFQNGKLQRPKIGATNPHQRENQLIAEPQGITPAHKRKQSVLAYLLLDVESLEETGNDSRLSYNRRNLTHCTKQPQSESKTGFSIFLLLRYSDIKN